MGFHLKENSNLRKKLNLFIQYFFLNEEGGSLLESGLLIALAMIMFLILITSVKNIITWVQNEIDAVINQDFFS